MSACSAERRIQKRRKYDSSVEKQAPCRSLLLVKKANKGETFREKNARRKNFLSSRKETASYGRTSVGTYAPHARPSGAAGTHCSGHFSTFEQPQPLAKRCAMFSVRTRTCSLLCDLRFQGFETDYSRGHFVRLKISFPFLLQVIGGLDPWSFRPHCRLRILQRTNSTALLRLSKLNIYRVSLRLFGNSCWSSKSQSSCILKSLMLKANFPLANPSAAKLRHDNTGWLFVVFLLNFNSFFRDGRENGISLEHSRLHCGIHFEKYILVSNALKRNENSEYNLSHVGFIRSTAWIPLNWGLFRRFQANMHGLVECCCFFFFLFFNMFRECEFELPRPSWDTVRYEMIKRLFRH